LRFLGLGDYHSLGDMYWRLVRSGHEVRVHVREPEAHEIYTGLVPRVNDWRAELPWIRDAGKDGIILCETASSGEIADALRRDGFYVVGGSELGDRLENDRAFGQRVMREVGMQTAATHGFHDLTTAVDFIRRNPARYVLKWSDGVSASTRNYVGELDDGSDVVALLLLERSTRPQSDGVDFVLMQHVTGVEVGIGAYFDGDAFLEPACIDWEHKRFFPGDLGELTGEMGTVVSYRHSRVLFERTLAKMAPLLKEAKHCGYLNINMIVNGEGVWPLEFTCRFGYPGFAICDALHLEGWDRILSKMAHGTGREIKTRGGFAVGVVLTVPPFPYEYGYAELSKGAAITFRAPLSDEERDHLHYGEVAMSEGRLITSGSLGYIMVVTGAGETIKAAQEVAYRRVGNIVVPNMRYRNDIGSKLDRVELATLSALGYLS